MEQRNGWQRALAAATKYEVHLFYYPLGRDHDDAHAAESQCIEHLHVHPVSTGWLGKRLLQFEPSFYAGYSLWHRMVYNRVLAIHQAESFDLCHLVTLCGFRQAGWLHRLGIPLVWGPIGGTHNFPVKFLKELGLWGQTRERLRSWINSRQLAGRRFRRRLTHTSATIAATEAAAAEIKQATGISLPVELETGLDYPVDPPRDYRPISQPLRILWAGRLRDWKGLPLLLAALQHLPQHVHFEFVVLGDGSSRKRWQRLARKMRIGDKIRWVSWPTYRETLNHYRRSDVFVFTSLRDTSGTGLLEALAAGCVIVGLNHQGAASIIDHNCGIPIPVTEPRSTVSSIARAIITLHDDRHLLHTLSRSATAQSFQYQWSLKGNAMLDIYDQILSQQIV